MQYKLEDSFLQKKFTFMSETNYAAYRKLLKRFDENIYNGFSYCLFTISQHESFDRKFFDHWFDHVPTWVWNKSNTINEEVKVYLQGKEIVSYLPNLYEHKFITIIIIQDEEKKNRPYLDMIQQDIDYYQIILNEKMTPESTRFFFLFVKT